MLAPAASIEEVELRHFHFFCGVGGGALGFNRGKAQVGNRRARFRCIGGIDVDARAIRDFDRHVGVRGTVLDLFDRAQYVDFHGGIPPDSWREATLEDIRRAAGYEHPHIVFMSAPCKGFSGLLSEHLSKTPKYQALNRLTLRGVWLMLEAFADHLPELILFENVPRIATRGRPLLDQIGELLRSYGYAVAETVHDCGELGGLAQSRKRFLLVARHTEAVPPFLYEPPKRRLRAIGEVLSRMPLPGDERGGPMHAIPNLHWNTWVRLAFVEPGADWRSLNRLRVVNGTLADYGIVPDDLMIPGSETLTGAALQVSDLRLHREHHKNVFRVVKWDATGGTVTVGHGPTNGGGAVADPRPPQIQTPFSKYAITGWDQNTRTVIAGDDSGAFGVADPRAPGVFGGKGKYRVASFEETGNTVIAASTTGHGAFGVADPRLGMQRSRGDNYLTAGHYGVIGWESSTGAVSAAAGHDNGRWNVADPRINAMPSGKSKLVARIRALDNTWHRPFTTLELAALQSLVDPDELFYDLDGNSDSRKREAIGNAVPPGAAQAIADVMGTTLLLAMSGETFTLSSQPIWVQPVAVALSVKTY
jgi:site-specific DNA-cytosine methylase